MVILLQPNFTNRPGATIYVNAVLYKTGYTSKMMIYEKIFWHILKNADL